MHYYYYHSEAKKNVELTSLLLEWTAENMKKDLKPTLLHRCIEHKNNNDKNASFETIVYSACQRLYVVSKPGCLCISSSSVINAECKINFLQRHKRINPSLTDSSSLGAFFISALYNSRILIFLGPATCYGRGIIFTLLVLKF